MFKQKLFTMAFAFIVASLCVVRTASQPFSAEDLSMAWKIITEVMKMWSTQEKEPPIPYLTFYNNLSDRYQRLSVLWDKETFADASGMKLTPLQDLKSAIPDLLLGYTNKIDPNQCNLFYVHLNSDHPINSDQIIAQMLELPPDFKDKYRQIFVRCKGIPGKCHSNTCKPSQEQRQAEPDADSQNIQYQLALDAYRYGKAHQIARNPAKVEEFEKELAEWGMDEFEIKSDVLQMIEQAKSSFEKELEAMATAFDWNEKMKKATTAAVNAKAAFESDRQVKFDKASWTITAFVGRFASFQDESMTKISYTVTTSNFRFVIPKSEREESLLQKYITGSGTVSRKFIRRITFLIEAEAAGTAEKGLQVPKPYQFALNNTN